VLRTLDRNALQSPALLTALAAREGEMLDHLRGIVAIDSGSYDAAGVDAVGDLLAARWADLGFACERVAVPGAGSYRRLRRKFRGRGCLMILGHLDTVWPKGTAAEWPFRIDDGLAQGPGVGDMKGGLVMAWAAVSSLLAADFDGVGEIRHVLVPDEELGSVGSRLLIEEDARSADWVLVLEPARDNGAVVVERGAVGAIIVRATGISAHVMHRDNGASAVHALACLVGPLEALSDPERGESVNVGILRGGDARQMVPRSCEMHIDLRAADSGGAGRLLARVLEIIERGRGERIEISVEGGITRPAFPAEASRDLFAAAAGVAQVLSIDYPSARTIGGSDGSFCAALGRPTLDGLGPVCFDSCSRRERIPVRSLIERGAVLAGLIAQLGTMQ